MEIVDSPKAEYTNDGKPRERTSHLTILRRVSIGALLALSVALNVFLWVSQRPVPAGGLSVLQGNVVDARGKAVRGALVFLADTPENMVTTNDSGAFLLENIPSGSQTVVVVRDEIGQTYTVDLTANAVNNAGSLTYNAPTDVFSGFGMSPGVVPQMTRSIDE